MHITIKGDMALLYVFILGTLGSVLCLSGIGAVMSSLPILGSLPAWLLAPLPKLWSGLILTSFGLSCAGLAYIRYRGEQRLKPKSPALIVRHETIRNPNS